MVVALLALSLHTNGMTLTNEYLLIASVQSNVLRNMVKRRENQDGSVGRHTAPPRTTRTDRKSNGREVGHQVDKKETYIQTSRRGGDGHQGGEDLRGHGNRDGQSVGLTAQAV